MALFGIDHLSASANQSSQNGKRMLRFMVDSYKDGAKIGETEHYESYQELAADLQVSAQPEYRVPVLQWAQSEDNDVPLEMMNGSIREVWTAVTGR